MKAKDADRAATLVSALVGLSSITRAAKSKAAENYDRRGMLITVEDICDAGSHCDGNGIELDLETVPLVVAAVRTIIKDQLKKLGVKT